MQEQACREERSFSCFDDLVVKKWWTSESIDRVEQQKVSINKLFEEIFLLPYT
jgi:hypothetical protein